MNTTYKNRVASPYQLTKKDPFDVSDKKHPVRGAIERCTGSFDITATFEEDVATLALFKQMPGIIAFLCTLKKDGKIIGQGRGTAVLNQMNRYLERTVNTAFGAAFVDASVRCAKVLDTLRPNASGSNNSNAIVENAYKEKESYTFEGITDKQRSYLYELIQTNVIDEGERNRLELQIDSLSKNEASEAIQKFTIK